MNTYKITLKGYNTSTLICAETAGKAKYQHYLQLDGLFDSFEFYLSFVESCKFLQKAKKEDYYRKDRDFELKDDDTKRSVCNYELLAIL